MDTSNSHRDDDFYLSDVMDRVVRYWWLSALCMVIGGLIGLLVSVFSKPIYESTSIITTVIDFAYSGNLTDYEEDHILSTIGDVIQSDLVMNPVITQGLNSGVETSAQKMRAALSASRQGFRWELSTRLSDPVAAQAANQLWLDAAIQALEQFRLDSIVSLAEINAQAGLENCFQQAVVVDPVSAYCSAAEFESLRVQINSIESDFTKGSLLTRLLASRLSFQVTQQPDLPLEPVHLGKNTSTLAGVLLGLLAAIILLFSNLKVWQKIGKIK